MSRLIIFPSKQKLLKTGGAPYMSHLKIGGLNQNKTKLGRQETGTQNFT
jgi:hypothetical protein